MTEQRLQIGSIRREIAKRNTEVDPFGFIDPTAAHRVERANQEYTVLLDRVRVKLQDKSLSKERWRTIVPTTQRIADTIDRAEILAEKAGNVQYDPATEACLLTWRGLMQEAEISIDADTHGPTATLTSR